MLKRIKTKRNQTKKHIYYSNLILNRYVKKNVEVIKFKDLCNPYFIEHTKKFNLFTVLVFLRFDDDDNPSKISVPNNVTYNNESENSSTFTTEFSSDFLQRVVAFYLSHKCDPKIIAGIETALMSYLVSITRKHYLEQPESMLYRKLIRRYYETTQDFEYKWLPDSFKIL